MRSAEEIAMSFCPHPHEGPHRFKHDCKIGPEAVMAARQAQQEARKEALEEAINLVVYGRDAGRTMTAVASNIRALIPKETT